MSTDNITDLVNNGGMKIGDWITLAAVVVALGIGVWSTIHANNLQKKERKERLLNKIIEWAIQIQNNSLEGNIPLDAKPPFEQMRLISEANSLFRYGATFTQNTHIAAITDKAFKKELKVYVDIVIIDFTTNLFLKGSTFGMTNLKENFRGTALEIIKELEDKIKGDPKIKAQLLKESNVKIATSVNSLLVKTGQVLADLK